MYHHGYACARLWYLIVSLLRQFKQKLICAGHQSSLLLHSFLPKRLCCSRKHSKLVKIGSNLTAISSWMSSSRFNHYEFRIFVCFNSLIHITICILATSCSTLQLWPKWWRKRSEQLWRCPRGCDLNRNAKRWVIVG